MPLPERLDYGTDDQPPRGTEHPGRRRRRPEQKPRDDAGGRSERKTASDAHDDDRVTSTDGAIMPIRSPTLPSR